MTRPTRYKENESSRDWIDEFCATRSVEEVRGAFLFNMGKYQRRYGKKDDHLQEALKIQDYANRLVEYERDRKQPTILELYGVTDQARAAALAAEWNDGEKRMDNIASSHGDGEHYESEWVEWDGEGECPVDHDAMVETEWTHGENLSGPGGGFRWWRGEDTINLVRYRLIHE